MHGHVSCRYQLGRVLARVLEEAGVNYWTSGGTTLGIVRYQAGLCLALGLWSWY